MKNKKWRLTLIFKVDSRLNVSCRRLIELNLSNKKLAIEHNKKILPRDMYGSTTLTEGDNIEIVHFIGGG